MFGNNPHRKQELTNGQTLDIKEIFYTIQGEGHLAGLPAVFVRVWGCNLACHFCDTDFDGDKREMSVEEIILAVVNLNPKTRHVVLTGGEPFRQNIAPLITRLNLNDFSVQVETAGTLYIPDIELLFPQGGRNSIVCSPKTPKLHPKILPLITSYKYIVSYDEEAVERVFQRDDDFGLPVLSTQKKGQTAPPARPHWEPERPENVYIQACDECNPDKNRLNLKYAADLCMRQGYRLSVQMHKLAGLP